MKRILTFVLVAAMMATLFAGCGNTSEPAPTEAPKAADNEAAVTEAPKPDDPCHITDEPVSFTFAAAMPANWGEAGEKGFFKMMEEKTGVHLDWNQFPLEVAAERVGIMMSGSDMPDAFYTHGNMTLDQCNTYGIQGLLVDLKPLILEHAPHIKEAFDKTGAWKAYDAGNGSIYNLPMLVAQPAANNTVYTELMINRELLEKLNLEMPTTTEEFYEVLKAMKGQKAEDGKDLIPLGYGPIYNYGDMLRGAFGFQDSTCGPSIMDGVYLMYDGEKITSIANTENYKEFVKYMNRLYTEGLIDQEIYTHDNNMFVAKGAEGRYGAIIDWAGPATLGPSRLDLSDGITKGQYVGVPVLAGPDGTKLTQNRYGGLRNACDFCMTTACEDPVTLIKYMDLLYDQDLGLGRQHYYGLEGEIWNFDENGKMVLNEFDHEKYHSWRPFSITTTIPFGAMYLDEEEAAKVWVSETQLFKGRIDTELGYNDAAKYPVLPNLSFTEDENAELAVMRTDLVEYIKSFEAACITGQKDIDAEWENHLKRLDTLQQDYMVEIYNNALARYLER